MFLDQEIERLIIENSANEDGSGGKWSAGAKQIRERLCDGLHTRSAARKDLKTVSHCKGVIVVDDILCIRKVREAFSEFEAQRKITYEHIREGYIIP